MRWAHKSKPWNPWSLWFAWHPVRLTDGTGSWVWLEWVERGGNPVQYRDPLEWPGLSGG